MRHLQQIQMHLAKLQLCDVLDLVNIEIVAVHL